MKNVLKLLIFITYTLIVFMTKNYYTFLVYLALNIIVQIIFKVNPIKALYSITRLLPYILFVVLINIILGDIEGAILVGIRLILVCNITYSFRKVLSNTGLANAIEILCTPLKVFRVNPKDISLMICISFAYIPILSREFNQIKYALKSKGMPMKIKNYQYILKPFFINVFKRTNEISYALKAKGYKED